MVRKLMFAVPVLLVLTANAATAQNRFAVDISGGAAFPTEDLGTQALKTGFGVGLTANVRLLPHTHIYVGGDYFRFEPEAAVLDESFDVTGWAFGAKFQHPMFNNIGGWLRAGGIYNHIEMEDADGQLIADTDHELGWEAGAGLVIPVTDRFSILPGARYRTFSATLTGGTTDLDVDMSYLAAELRLSWTFGANPMVAAIR